MSDADAADADSPKRTTVMVRVRTRHADAQNAARSVETLSDEDALHAELVRAGLGEAKLHSVVRKTTSAVPLVSRISALMLEKNR